MDRCQSTGELSVKISTDLLPQHDHHHMLCAAIAMRFVYKMSPLLIYRFITLHSFTIYIFFEIFLLEMGFHTRLKSGLVGDQQTANATQIISHHMVFPCSTLKVLHHYLSTVSK